MLSLKKTFKSSVFLMFITLSIMAQNAYSKQSMRKCLLLPMTDSVGGAIAFKVFEEVEYYLKNSEWCEYKSNSGIMDILASYRQNMAHYLRNKSVLKLISEKSDAGSLIKVEIVNQVGGADLKIEVIGSNGEDIYFKEKTRLKTDDITVLAQTIQNWLAVYEANIPYDGRLIGILGKQFTVDFGKFSGALAGDQVEIVRPMQKKKHPLLNEIVAWETNNVARGTLTYVANRQSQGEVKRYDSRSKTRLGDWVRLKKEEMISEGLGEKFFKENRRGSKKKFGKLGRLGLLVDLGSGSIITTSGGNSEEIGGALFGFGLFGEIWATRNYFFSYEMNQKFGKFKTKEGNFSLESNSVSFGTHKLKMGYRYLPLGFFYGPQVDASFGYAVHKFGMENQISDGLVETTVSAIILGARGDIPLKKLMRIFLEVDFFIKSYYEEKIHVYGEKDSGTGYYLAFGGSYNYIDNINIEAKFGITDVEIDFENPERDVNFKESGFIKTGLVFTF